MPDIISTDTPMSKRFRGYLPVIIDVETGGFNSHTDALLEIAAVLVSMDDQGRLYISDRIQRHVQPFLGANLDAEALKFNKIDPFHPSRQAVNEREALSDIFNTVRHQVKSYQCQRAILVGHNPSFDLGFLHAAANRCQIKRNPFHPFSCFDTATLGALALGQTVLARASEAANIAFDQSQAHSALYDAERTAELFCAIVNQWLAFGGWDPIKQAPGWPGNLLDKPKEL
jgi:ribonuclease T